MRKTLSASIVILVIVGIFSEFIVPLVLSSAAQVRLKEMTHSPDLKVSLQSRPGLALLLGNVDRVEITAKEAMLGDVRANDLVLVGEKMSIDSKNLITGGGFKIKNAGHLHFSGIVTEKSLAELIEKKVDKVEEVAVAVAPDKITVTGKANLLGHKLNIELDGMLLQRDNSIFLHANRLNLARTRLGKSFIDSLIGDVQLVDFDRVNLPLELKSIEQRPGDVFLTFEN